MSGYGTGFLLSLKGQKKSTAARLFSELQCFFYQKTIWVLSTASWRVFLQHLRSCEDTCFLFIRFFYLLQGGEVHRVECFSRLHLSVAIVIALSFAPNMQNRERKPCFCSKANGIVVMLVSATMHLYTSGNTVSKHIIRSNNILHKLAFKNT